MEPVREPDMPKVDEVEVQPRQYTDFVKAYRMAYGKVLHILVPMAAALAIAESCS